MARASEQKSKKKTPRGKGGKFVPGASPNPTGKPRGRTSGTVALQEAFERYAVQNGGTTFFDFMFQRAADLLTGTADVPPNPTLALALLQKLVPNRTMAVTKKIAPPKVEEATGGAPTEYVVDISVDPGEPKKK